MITKTADELAAMTLPELMKEYPQAATLVNSLTITSAMMGISPVESVVAAGFHMGATLAAHTVLESDSMLGFEEFMARMTAIIRICYFASYLEIKQMHDEIQHDKGVPSGRPS